MKQKKQKFVPLEKQSKRQQKEYYSTRRKDWNGINPVTRVMTNAKVYNRKKSGKRYEHEPLPGFLYIYFSFFISSARYEYNKFISLSSYIGILGAT